jgi:N-acetylglutamate synthase-like GNAT family acetyltransferase
VLVRRATLADEAIAIAILDEYDEAIGVVVRDDAATRRGYLTGRGGLWIAEAGGDVAGCVALKGLARNAERAGEVKRLYVRAAWRKTGLGDHLMDALEADARSSGYDALYLDTFAALAAAVRLYERRGYVRIARYNDNPQAEVFMRLGLRPR